MANDDGVQFPGLWTLVEELARRHQVTVVAPDREQSGVGTAISLHRILRVREVKAEVPGVAAFAVEGTPGDCVILGLGELAKGTELVVAGINEGAKRLGATLSAPYMTLSFMALLVIPKLKLSDKGLFDGEAFAFTDLFC